MSSSIKSARALALAQITLLAAPAHAEDRVEYHIKVTTADAYLAGTDNHIDFRLCDAAGNCTDTARIPGNSEAGDVDEGNFALKDIGAPKTIKLDVIGDLADKWRPYDIWVERRIGGKVDGRAWFLIDKELSYDEETFSANSVDAASTLKVESSPKTSTRTIEWVTFCNNLSGKDAYTCSPISTMWEEIEEIGWTKGTAEDFAQGVQFTFTYGNDQSMAKAEAGVWASFGQHVEEQRSGLRASSSATEMDYSTVAPPGQACLSKMRIVAPAMQQVVTGPDGKEYVLEWVSDSPTSVKWNERECLPSSTGKNVPKSRLDRIFLNHMSAADKAEFEEWYEEAKEDGLLGGS